MAEADFRFGWMNIYVDFACVAMQEKQSERVAAGRHQVVIGGRDRVQQDSVTDQTAVDEQKNRVAIQLLNVGTGNQTFECELRRFGVRWIRQGELESFEIEIDEIVDNGRTEDLKGSVSQAGYGRGVQQLAAFVIELESLVGMAQTIVCDERAGVSELGCIRA